MVARFKHNRVTDLFIMAISISGRSWLSHFFSGSKSHDSFGDLIINNLRNWSKHFEHVPIKHNSRLHVYIAEIIWESEMILFMLIIVFLMMNIYLNFFVTILTNRECFTFEFLAIKFFISLKGFFGYFPILYLSYSTT